MSRIRYCVEALLCVALLASLVSNSTVVAIVCAVTLGVAVVVAPSRTESGESRGGEGQ